MRILTKFEGKKKERGREGGEEEGRRKDIFTLLKEELKEWRLSMKKM